MTPGAKLGRYEIRSKIGAGGMGEVYLAQDTKLDRLVALKVLPAEVASDQKRMSRFVQEAKAASALNHPNILTIHEVDEANSVHFIVTEFIEGDTLRQRMAQASLKLSEVIEVGTQIANALSAAHTSGIVHRDIKPDNVMLRRDGIVKVLDFGVAKLTEQPPESVDPEAPTSFKTDPGTVVGTVAYMSPEQARGMTVDARTDIFSLGVLMYEMVAGCLPFEGSSSSEVMAAILNEKDPPPLARYAREVPTELERIVEKALRKDREQRYQTIKDLLLDLQALKQQREFQAKLERSVPPDKLEAPEKSEALLDQLGVKPLGESDKLNVVEQRGTHVSSAEYLVNQVRFHKRGAVTIVAALVLLSVAGVVYYFYFVRSGSRGAIDSIAVLPLVNTGNDTETEYLSDGIAEALINSLTELQQLRVTARSTAFRYKGKDVDPQVVGRELNVRAVLMGRVRKIGDSLNVQVDLVDVTTGAQLWGQEYERKASDVLAVKQAIAREVTEKLRLRLSAAEQQQLVKRDTTNAAAYQLYLRGRFHWAKRRPEEHRKAIEYFQQAITLAPNYALGFAGLADAYSLLAAQGGAPASEVMPKAKEAALKAVALDEEMAEGHTALARVLTVYDWDFSGAERELKRALELNPNYATTHQWYSRLLSCQGKHEEALAKGRRALELDPLALDINWAYGIDLFYARKYDESIAQLKKTQELDTDFPRVQNQLARNYQMQGRYAESVEAWAKNKEMEGEPEKGKLFRDSFAKGGWQEFMRTIVKQPSGFDLLAIANFYAALGQKDKAFAFLNAMYERRAGGVSVFKIEPRLDPLRDDPRFQELLKKAGL